MNKTRRLLVVPIALLAFATASSSRAIDVYMDWSGAAATMAAAWTVAGYGSGAGLTGPEISGIISSAMGKIDFKYSAFTVDFMDTTPGGLYEWMKLGATTGSTTTYGSSSGIDWRNRVKDGGGEIYLANFGGILSSTMFTRAENLSRFASAIANTTAHELGHTLGLQHYDAYGVPGITAPGYAFSGEQNEFIMATGVTGLTPLARGHDRFFNPFELLKLEYADGVAAVEGTSVAELPGAKDTLATAQLVAGVPLAISGLPAINIEGTASMPGEVDLYKFFMLGGSAIMANTLSHGHYMPYTDTTLTLMDSTGTPMFTNTDINFLGDDFMTGTPGHYYSDDSLILQFVVPSTGFYYMKVMGMAPGKYDLLMGGLAPVPEPATIAVLGLGIVALARRRRS